MFLLIIYYHYSLRSCYNAFNLLMACTFLSRWFRQLNRHFGVSGQCHFLYKPHGCNKTEGITDEQALKALKKGLRGNVTTYIYHCQNHYFCPIGYEDVPHLARHAYR